MQHAEIEWENEQAVSKRYGDIYFSRLGGIQESRHVFIALNELETRFQNSEYFQIGELGFGSGLNFILSWQLWLQAAPQNARLHFVSTELYPMKAEDIRHSHKAWPEISNFSEQLTAALPRKIEGTHRICFSGGRVTLTLLYGEAAGTLKNIEDPGSRFDCWFLDGFSPQKNPEMWQPELLESVTSLTRENGTLSTYSVAGELRRNLEKLGWSLQKVRGFANKREALSGRLGNVSNQNISGLSPWFSLRKLTTAKDNSAVVIGAGLAGCWSAYCLARKGVKVTLIERHAGPASAASGNPAALAIPYLSLDRNFRHRFYLNAFDFLRREIKGASSVNPAAEFLSGGVSHRLPHDRAKSLSDRFEKLSVPQETACLLNEHELLYPDAFILNPGEHCRRLLHSMQEGIVTKFSTEALSIVYKNGGWTVIQADEQIIAESATVVIANSYDALAFQQSDWLPVTRIRGEICLIEDKFPQRKIVSASCGASYLIPLEQDRYLIGASYNQVFLDPQPSEKIQNELLDKSRKEFGILSESAKILSSRVAFRASSYDRLPYAGPLPDFDSAMNVYHQYRRGFAAQSFPDCSYMPGLYVNIAHGSRGVVSAPLCAEIIASMVCAEPLPIERDLLPALLPTRWIIRQLARGNDVKRGLSSEADFS